MAKSVNGRKEKSKESDSQNRHRKLLDDIFFTHYKKGQTELSFLKEDIVTTAARLDVLIPKNVPDMIYEFRSRGGKSQRIVDTEPKGFLWIIRGAGKGKYKFALVKYFSFAPQKGAVETKLPDATPGVIVRYAWDDEQAVLAKIRFNRLIDIFTGLTCYSLQSHFKTSDPDVGQFETDEIYIGIDKRGVHYVIPVEAKGEKDELGIVQIENNFSIGRKPKFKGLICKPIGAQFSKNGPIVLQEFAMIDNEIRLASEKHYRLVPPNELSIDELEEYKQGFIS